MTPDALEQERAEFERWHQRLHDFDRLDDGDYASLLTRCAWFAWQARAASAQAVIARLEGEKARLREALEQIRLLYPEAIGDTGYVTGPKALLDAAQRIARGALYESGSSRAVLQAGSAEK